nr:response regulator transcription factor [Nocardioides ginsengisegetis]
MRVVAVDDHPVFLRGIVACLEDAPDVEVCGTATSAADALATIAATAPDVVLLDLNLGDGNGIAVTRSLRADGFRGAVLVLTMYEDELALRAAFEAGARGYLLKGADQDEILGALRTVVAGGLVVGAQLADRLADLLGSTRPEAPRRVAGLSDRETEVLSLIVAGRTNTEITRELVVSAKTVRNHITNIFAKLGVTDREQAVERARELGLSHRLGDPRWQ